MNLKNTGIGALIVLAPLLNGCKKATETISMKSGPKYLTEETVRFFAEKYSPVDTLMVTDKMSPSFANYVML